MRPVDPVHPAEMSSSFSRFRPTRKRVVKKKKVEEKSTLEPSSDWTIDDIIDFEKETGVDFYDTKEQFTDYY
jgi:hypothetical protein